MPIPEEVRLREKLCALCDTSAKLALRRVADKLPRLTQFGIGFGPRQANTDGTRETSEQYNERFRQSREDLCTDYSAKAFLRSMAFLSEVGHIQTFSDSWELLGQTHRGKLSVGLPLRQTTWAGLCPQRTPNRSGRSQRF